MDARDRLKRYLEQRREMGEKELVLDGMTVADVMRIVGAVGKSSSTSPSLLEGARESPPSREAASEPPAPERSEGSPGDWRDTLRASGAEPAPATGRAQRKQVAASPPAPAGSIPAMAAEPSAAPPPALRDPPVGIVVGASSRELFAAPSAQPATVEEIAEVIKRCTRCSLYTTATNAVPGEGNPRAELVCVGEAPGANEDATGRPFVGQAGQLLTKILAAIDLAREDVFICNVLKHRPPGNRNPLPDEVAACSPYLVQQLDVIRPKVIIAFGTFAAQTLLNTRLAIGKLRGSVHRYYGIPLIVTYHPAALLRNPAWKRPTWEDVQLARRILDAGARSGS